LHKLLNPLHSYNPRERLFISSTLFLLHGMRYLLDIRPAVLNLLKSVALIYVLRKWCCKLVPTLLVLAKSTS